MATAKVAKKGSKRAPKRKQSAFDALIIGAGFSGPLPAALPARPARPVAWVLEAGDGVGGTWYWNRYPGARCDSESHSYCFTFDENCTGVAVDASAIPTRRRSGATSTTSPTAST